MKENKCHKEKRRIWKEGFMWKEEWEGETQKMGYK